MSNADQSAMGPKKGRLIYRQKLLTRITHWLWALCLFFLLLSGLQIFNAHPALYIGQQSGFEYDNAVLVIGDAQMSNGRRGETTLFGHTFDTTGVLGLSGPQARPQTVAFPGWATIPSFRDLATGRVVHFFFAWTLVATLLVWLIASLSNGHAWRDVLPNIGDLKKLPRDILDHLRLRFFHTAQYNVLQKLAYSGVMFVLLPLMILTGLAMSPGVDAGAPWLLEVFGGRQTARTIHFFSMTLLVLFFLVHILMVIAAGPINELRSMVTGWYRASDPDGSSSDE